MRFAIVTAHNFSSEKIKAAESAFQEYGTVDFIWEDEIIQFPEQSSPDVIYAHPAGLVGLKLCMEALQRGISVVNNPLAMLASINRVTQASLLDSVGVPIPKYICTYPQYVPFLPFYRKDIYDLDVKLYSKSLSIVRTEEEQKSLPPMPIFAQADVPNIQAEYKVYLVDKHHWVFEQDDDTRTRIEDPASEIIAIAQKARQVLGLTICSVDIVEAEGKYTLIDLNVSPRLESLADGMAAFAQYLVNKYGKLGK
jgi:glutathione synthase/RimK-type ligase-like ATP-grasp enzyme